MLFVADSKYIIEVEVDAANAAQTLTNLRNSVAGLNDTANNPALDKLDRDLGRLGTTSKGTAQSLASTRYALYDVSNTLGILGAGLIAATAAIYGAGIAWERDFANVVRTSGLDQGSAEVQTLRENLKGLASELPVTASDLAKIATLAGQLGVAAGDITGFTSVVARFSATTNLSVEDTATAFGRLSALLPDIADGTYSLEQLGSAILAVGTNSVATESEITRIAVQLSSMASYAGLTADELIGLSGALASVGTQPELARGTITRLFTLFGKAVSDNGDKLAAFASVAGVSSDQFASAFGTDKFGPIFQRFVEGLGNVSASGGDTVAVLNDLGITSVRDVPALTRLATAYSSTGKAGGLLAELLDTANTSIKSGGELQRQYSIIADTVASKLQILVNNFQNLITTIGGGGAIFGGLLDILNGLLEALTDIAANPVGNFLLQLTTIVTGLAGVLAIVAAVAVRGVAGFLAMTTALKGLSTGAAGATINVRGLAGAMGALGAVVAVVTLGLLVGDLLKTQAAANGASVNVDDLAVRLAGAGDKAKILREELGRGAGGSFLNEGGKYSSKQIESAIKDLTKYTGLQRDLVAGLDVSATNINSNLKALDDGFSDLVKGGNAAKAAEAVAALREQFNLSDAQIKAALPEYYKQIALSAEAAGVGTAEYVAGLQGATDATAEAAIELTALGEAVQSGIESFVSFSDILSQSQEANRAYAEGVAEASESSKDSWEDYYDGSSVSLQQFSDAVIASVASASTFAENVRIIADSGNTAFATELAKLGPEGASIAQQAVDAITSGQGLGSLEDAMVLQAFLASDAFAETFTGSLEANTPALIEAYQKGGIEAVKALITATREGGPQLQAVIDQYNLTASIKPDVPATNSAFNTMLRSLSGRSVNLGVNLTKGQAGFGVVPEGRASGGPIWGPGTARSDSIPTMLSNGEYVVQASAVRKLGLGYLNRINQGRAPQKFASGGAVGGSFPSSMVTSWGPAERALVRSIAQQTTQAVLQLDGQTIASNQANVNKRNQAQGRG